MLCVVQTNAHSTLDLLESPQQELPEASCVFDLPNHRFDDRLARRVAPAANTRNATSSVNRR